MPAIHVAQAPRVFVAGAACGNSLACTCLAISSSWAARRSASSLSAVKRRCASTAWLTSSKLTNAKEFRSTSSKRVNTPPQTEGGSAGIDGAVDAAVEEVVEGAAAVAAARSYFTRLRRGACRKRTTRLLHSRDLAGTSSVAKTDRLR